MHFTDIHGSDAIHPGKSSPPLFADSAVLSFFSVYTFVGFSQMPIDHAKCDKYRQKVNGLLDYSKPLVIMQMQFLPIFWVDSVTDLGTT